MYQAEVGAAGQPDVRYCTKVLHVNGNFSEETLVHYNTDLHLSDRPLAWRSSIGIDDAGHIHVTGAMNRWPRSSDWPEGMPYDLRDAHIMYWRTSKPLDIHSFEFLGHDEDNLPPSLGWYGTYSSLNGDWKFINDNEGRLYAWIPTQDLNNDQPLVGGLQGFGFARFHTATMKWEWLGADVPEKGVKLLMYEAATDDATHVQCNFDRMDILQCVLSFEKQLYYARSCDYGETFYTSEGRLVELPMNIIDETHTPEHIMRNLAGRTKMGSGYMKVNIFEDGTPFIVQRGDINSEEQGRDMRDVTHFGKDYETGKWKLVMEDFTTSPQIKIVEHSHFMDRLGVTAADSRRRWLLKSFREDADTLQAAPMGGWCDERYYKDTGNMACFGSGGVVKTTIHRPVEYPVKWG